MVTRNTTTEGSRDGLHRAGLSRFRSSARTDGKPTRGGRGGAWFLAVGLAGLIVLWAVAGLTFGWVSFAVDLSAGTKQNVATANLIAKLFGTLVLLLLAADPERQRLRWLAGGFLALAFGQLLDKFLEPMTIGTFDSNTQLYYRLLMWTTVAALFAVGLLPAAAPRLPWRWLLAIFAAFVSLVIAISGGGKDLLPPLIQSPGGIEEAVASGARVMPGLTGWYFAFASVLLVLAAVAAVGALRQGRRGTLAGWVVVAAVLLAGAQMHGLVWPPVQVQALTSTQVLHFAFASAVGVGGILELRRLAAERSALLAAEKERSERLRELSVLKADFTAMVAHELGTPLAAIQGYTDMLKTGEVPPDLRTQALDAIQTETDALKALVADVRAASSIEREDFTVEKIPVEFDDLLEDAVTFIKAYDGGNPLKVEAEVHGRVLADAERIGQVLRNLLSNAAKYSEPGSPIELRATRNGTDPGRVRIEVVDWGRGIHPDDLKCIFEKFGRGRDQAGQKVAGAGLGLYLSRCIVRAHGSDLTVRSEPGEGSAFAFELELAR